MKSNLKLLIVDDVHESLMDRLTNMSIDYSYQPDIEIASIPSILQSYTGIVVRSKIQLNSQFLSNQPQLKLIARAGSGMDNIDLKFAVENGIACINAPEANANAVGELAVGLLLSLNRRIVKSNREVNKLVWDREGNRGLELSNAIVGIIGFGNTGSSVAHKLSGFGCQIMAYDKYKTGYGTNQIKESSLEDVMSESDIISFHIPLTFETEKWISDEWISKLGKNITLLNLSRGGIMDTKSVISSLKKGKIVAFGTDVLENERLTSLNADERQDFDWLNDQDNVIITPHIGGWTKESYVGISEVLADKIEAFIKTGLNKANASNMSTLFVV